MPFVIGIFLLSTRIKPMLVQVTTFTVAHDDAGADDLRRALAAIERG